MSEKSYGTITPDDEFPPDHAPDGNQCGDGNLLGHALLVETGGYQHCQQGADVESQNSNRMRLHSHFASGTQFIGLTGSNRR